MILHWDAPGLGPGRLVQPLFKVSANVIHLYKPCQVFACVYHEQTMYNIKEAAARAGVTVPVLRAWERRYGIVNPGRTASGYRQFVDDDLLRIRAMRELVESGWSPSAAAESILAGNTPRKTAAADPEPTRVDGRAEARTALADRVAADFGQRMVAAARSLEPESLAAVLDDLFSRGSFERVAEDLLFPALEGLGDAWASGAITVASEHLASNAVLRRLALALEAAGTANGHGRAIVVGLPPGGRHELGALAFAVAARRAGLPVVYLGPDLPVVDWISAATGAVGAVIGVVTATDRKSALEVARRLRAAYPNLVIGLGGRATPPAVDYLRLPDRLQESVAALKAAIVESAAS